MAELPPPKSKPKPFEKGKEYQTIYDEETDTITEGEIIPGGPGIPDIFIPNSTRKLKNKTSDTEEKK